MSSPATDTAAAPLLTLVVLAAGMGSRYGGLKQIDPMGPSGETVLDYTVHDAARAGFGRVLFIIRRDFADAFRASVGERFAGRVQVDYAFQELDLLPEGGVLPVGRVKPWGTGHALWCARAALNGPFAVVNADDFYGAQSLAALAAFLRAQSGGAAGGVPVYAMVGFPLGNTLSEHGAVSRGVCTVAADGALRDIEEHTGIRAAEVGAGRRYDPATPVSMNCWGFTPEFLPQLDAGWLGFFAAHGGEEKAEFYLPAAVNALVQAGAAHVLVLPTADHWFGVTYREDKPRVQAALAGLVACGVYASPLK
ncbi:MAG: NTP transferase domain-containing protein [Verrucomicrobia bacterium]|nr:NTP transferase domain-containing protein [Verrucomicrobiota bacterium]